MRQETRTVPAPADLGVELVSVPEGADLELTLRLEGVTEGVLVTGTATAPLAGECARCLDPVSSTVRVQFQELFCYEADDQMDGYLLDGDLLDLEPALRDALVPELPLAPLCADDCLGLCADCGVRLADAGAGHDHAETGTSQTGTTETGTTDTGTTDTGRELPLEATPDGLPVPERRKER